MLRQQNAGAQGNATAEKRKSIYQIQQRRCRQQLCCELRAPQLPTNEALRRRAGCPLPCKVRRVKPHRDRHNDEVRPKAISLDTFFGALQRKYPGCRPGPANLKLHFLRNQDINYKTAGTRPRPAPDFLSKPTKSKQKGAPLRGAGRDGKPKLVTVTRWIASVVSFDSPSGDRWQGATRGFVSCEAGVKRQLVEITNKTPSKTACRCFRGSSAGAGELDVKVSAFKSSKRSIE